MTSFILRHDCQSYCGMDMFILRHGFCTSFLTLFSWWKSGSDKGEDGVCDEDVAEGLACESSGKDEKPVGTHDAEGDGDG